MLSQGPVWTRSCATANRVYSIISAYSCLKNRTMSVTGALPDVASRKRASPAQKLSLPHFAMDSLRCPVCAVGGLKASDDSYGCTHPGCGEHFPVVEGVPILLDERSSVFRVEDYVSGRPTTLPERRESVLKSLARALPTLSKNLAAHDNYQAFVHLLLEDTPRPLVLVIGGSVAGQGMHPLLDDPRIALVETDVAFGSSTALVCDAHDIPFRDEVFDGVVVQAVLEHVLNPYACVEEIHRVLSPSGLVYAETPFMQQVHMGPYDFTRFTHLGHRRLFRRFEEIASGAACGPGMALAWAWQYFLLSFATHKGVRSALRVVARLTSWFLKYFDYYLLSRPGALDAASGFYFLGRKSHHALSDEELLKSYRGAF